MLDHPGFEYWEATDLQFPFPVGEIDLSWGDEESAKASVDFTPPAAQPERKTAPNARSPSRIRP